MFRDEILKDFTNRFRGMQGSLLRTILLDPRLAAMNGFTSGKRSRAMAHRGNELDFDTHKVI